MRDVLPMKITIPFFSAILVFACSTLADEPQKSVASKRGKKVAGVDLYPSFKSDWDKDFRIRVGMPVDELKKYIKANNAKVRDAKPPAWETAKFHPPAYAYKELHLHVFVRMKRNEDDPRPPDKNALTYWVNGRTQFWMDLAIENDKVKNIYISCGNWSQMMPAFRFKGDGDRKSEYFTHPKSTIAVSKSKESDPAEP